MTKTIKITKKERFAQIVDVLATVEADADLIAFCEAEIASLEKKAAKAKEVAATKKANVDELAVAVQDALTGEFATIADITALVAGEDETITSAKVSYRLAQLVKAGVAESTDVKIGGGEGVKARAVKAYRIV